MKKDLPSIFANKIDRKIENNKTCCVTHKDDKREAEEIKEYKGIRIGKNINDKINDIFNSPKYVYKADVIITTNDGEQIKKIVGKNGNNLITMENELINIDTINDIKFKQ